MSDRPMRLTKWIGLGLALLAGAVYLVTLSAGPFPGESAAVVARHGGLSPRLSTLNPLWSMIAGVVAGLPFGTLASRLNVFSAICGALSVWLFHMIVAWTVFNSIEPRRTSRVTAVWAAQMAGITASLFLMFSIPFWVVSNRAHPGAFDVLLLLALTWLFHLYTRRLSERLILLFAALYGIGTAEFTTLILFAPAFALYFLFVLWRNEQFRVGLLVRVGIAYAAGLLFYLLAAGRVCAIETYDLLDLTGYFHAIWTIWREQYGLLARGLPQVGWLLIVVVGVVPWLTAILVCRRALNQEKDWGHYVLHFVMTIVLIGVMFNAKFAPWYFLGFQKVLVTPYVLLAACFGYLVAYWYLVPGTWWGFPDEKELPWFKRWLGGFLVAAAVALVAGAAWRNLPESDGRAARPINRYAGAMIQSLSGRTWLVTDGGLDHNLLIAARELNTPVKVLSLQWGNSPVYMKYMAGFFDDVRLKSLMEAGMIPFLQEWIRTDPEIEKKLAIVSLCDLWLSVDQAAIPNKTLFLGASRQAEADMAALLAEHQRFWAETIPPLREVREAGGPLSRLADFLLRQSSMVANNLGVLLEDAGRPADAFSAYAKAREIYPENISALLNQASMIDRGVVSSKAAAVKKAMGELKADQRRRYFVWSLSRFFGYVRTPDAFANLGFTWALSGNPGLAVAGFKRAMELGLQNTDAAKQTMAALYLAQDQEEQGETLYRELLAKDEKNAAAMLGLSRVAARKGDIRQAGAMLEKAEKAGVPKPRVALEWARLHVQAGEMDKARIMLQELVETTPDLPQAWVLLAGVLLEQKADARELDECVRKLNSLKGQGFSTAVVLGQIAFSRNETSTARRHFDQALALRPNSIPVLEQLLRIDFAEGRRDLGDTHVRQLLALDPGHQLGNYILGSLQIGRKEYTLAENSLRKSLERKENAEALNDLASLLEKRGALDEAEALARRSLKLNPKLYATWDTLGTILVKRNQIAEAEDCFKKAISCYPDYLEAATNLAELYARKGEKQKALDLIQNLLDKGSELSLKDRERLHHLRQELQRK